MSPARSSVSPWTGNSSPSRTTMLIQMLLARSAISATARPSTTAPSATLTWRAVIRLGLRRTPIVHGSGLIGCIGTPNRRATVGNEAALHDDGEDHHHDDDAVEPLGIRHVGRQQAGLRARSAPPLESGEQTRTSRSPRSNCAGSRQRPTTSGRMMTASATPRMSPGSQDIHPRQDSQVDGEAPGPRTPRSRPAQPVRREIVRPHADTARAGGHR